MGAAGMSLDGLFLSGTSGELRNETRVITIPLSEQRFRKLAELAVLSVRELWIRLSFWRAGFRCVRIYIVRPDLQRPTFVYEKGTMAERYALTHLRAPVTTYWRRALERLVRYELGAGAVVFVGIRQ